MTTNDPHKSRAHFDIPLVILVFLMAAFGVLSVSVATFSTSSAAEDTILNYIVSSYYGMRQAIFLLISPIIIGVVTYVIPYEFVRRRPMVFYYAACGLLAITLVTNRAQGVKAWTDIIWGYTIQPSEFVKLACIIVIAKYLESTTDPLGNFQSWIKLITLMLPPVGLTLLQGEMGSVLVVVFVFGIMLFFGGLRIKILVSVLVIGIGGIGLVLAYFIASGTGGYRVERILSMVNPALVDEGATYQVNNSKIAIGSGGLNGRGMFVEGAFSQLDYVPEDWTDFIFSTIGEAFGFVGCLLVILGYLLIILRMLYLARYTLDRFGQMVIIGVVAMLLFHVFENIGMTTGLLPVTGIPLPFLSYGGSNMVTNMIGVGMVLNVTKNRSVSIMPGITPQTGATRKWSLR